MYDSRHLWRDFQNYLEVKEGRIILHSGLHSPKCITSLFDFPIFHSILRSDAGLEYRSKRTRDYLSSRSIFLSIKRGGDLNLYT